MKWLINFFTSSIGRKLIMSLTGLFLILFLVIHLLGNLQLLVDDGGVTFNAYAYMMTHNPLIKVVAYGNYFFILLHAFMGFLLWSKNKAAKGSKYAVRSDAKHSSRDYIFKSFIGGCLFDRSSYVIISLVAWISICVSDIRLESSQIHTYYRRIRKSIRYPCSTRIRNHPIILFLCDEIRGGFLNQIV